MQSAHRPVQHLLSLPPRMADAFEVLEKRTGPSWHAGHDPEGQPLGSGGGSAHLLVEGWKATRRASESFMEWLTGFPKLIIHAGGQSRRLPAYAATGKALMPIPVFRWGRGQRFDQSLLDVQVRDYERVLGHAGSAYAVMITSGDVLLRFGPSLPAFPEVDVLGLGMRASPEVACQFGVFFTHRREPGRLKCFLQKPSPARIRELAADHAFLVDTGMWLLSPRGVGALLRRCGGDPDTGTFRGGVPSRYELYAELGLSLGSHPAREDPALAGLTAAVVDLPSPEFHHFGTSRQMIESVTALQNRETGTGWGRGEGAASHPDQCTQNSRVGAALHREKNHTLWIENSVVPATWQLACDHVLTNIPGNAWDLELEAGVCLDAVPVGTEGWVLRAYGIDDAFSGEVGEEGTLWLGRPAPAWFRERGLDRLAAGVDGDIQRAPLFPVLPWSGWDAEFVRWLFARAPRRDEGHARRWLSARRLSAQQLQSEVALGRLYRQREELRNAALQVVLEHRAWSVFDRLDLDAAGAAFARSDAAVPPRVESAAQLDGVHQAMFRAAVLRHRGDPGWRGEESHAFALLREMLAREACQVPVVPRPALVEDQIVWARSPVRFDLAGGWTDTPPYCLEHGGAVVNVAVDLNGQPPMQVFVRLAPHREIVLRSIDLGAEERITRYEQLAGHRAEDGPFAVAKGAFALAGFLPMFHGQGGHESLQAQLADFGAGLELSLLSAVPKGSGLGTSSILAATVLAALSEACGLGWDRSVLCQRTLALEQMIGAGGGWQDQAGGVYPGAKLLETGAGMEQVPRVRWLPERVLGPAVANRTLLLYYTGLTRRARGILGEIVRGLFLNAPGHLATLEEIGASAQAAALALERCDPEELARVLRTTWRLKQQLDAGTNPEAVQSILDGVSEHLAAATLPGAGGGGYLLLMARDEDAAQRIRRILGERPPNPRARFVEFSVSSTGLQVTRS